MGALPRGQRTARDGRVGCDAAQEAPRRVATAICAAGVASTTGSGHLRFGLQGERRHGLPRPVGDPEDRRREPADGLLPGAPHLPRASSYTPAPPAAAVLPPLLHLRAPPPPPPCAVFRHPRHFPRPRRHLRRLLHGSARGHRRLPQAQGPPAPLPPRHPPASCLLPYHHILPSPPPTPPHTPPCPPAGGRRGRHFYGGGRLRPRALHLDHGRLLRRERRRHR